MYAGDCREGGPLARLLECVLEDQAEFSVGKCRIINTDELVRRRVVKYNMRIFKFTTSLLDPPAAANKLRIA
jgi:hypothetical protein